MGGYEGIAMKVLIDREIKGYLVETRDMWWC